MFSKQDCRSSSAAAWRLPSTGGLQCFSLTTFDDPTAFAFFCVHRLSQEDATAPTCTCLCHLFQLRVAGLPSTTFIVSRGSMLGDRPESVFIIWFSCPVSGLVSGHLHHLFLLHGSRIVPDCVYHLLLPRGSGSVLNRDHHFFRSGAATSNPDGIQAFRYYAVLPVSSRKLFPLLTFSSSWYFRRLFPLLSGWAGRVEPMRSASQVPAQKSSAQRG